MERKIKLYNGAVTLIYKEGEIFGKKRHWFEHPDGRKINGVTSVTGLLDKSGPLMYWAVKMMGLYLVDNWDIKKIRKESEKITLIETARKEYREAQKEAADIGTEIHKLCEKWIKGQKVEMPENEKVRNGYIAFLKWIKEKEKIKILTSEEYVYSKKYDYAGIMDWDGEDDGELVMGDFKSSKGIYNDMRYQIAAYWQAREEETGKKYSKGYIVQFGKETGDFNILEIPRREYLKDFQAFLGLLKTKRREKELK